MFALALLIQIHHQTGLHVGIFARFSSLKVDLCCTPEMQDSHSICPRSIAITVFARIRLITTVMDRNQALYVSCRMNVLGMPRREGAKSGSCYWRVPTSGAQGVQNQALARTSNHSPSYRGVQIRLPLFRVHADFVGPLMVKNYLAY